MSHQQQQQQQQQRRGMTTSSSRSPQQLQARQEERQKRGAQVAFDEISAQIRSWSSPMVSSTTDEGHHEQQQHQESSSSYHYEQDAVEWMKQTIQEEEENPFDGDEDITMLPGDDDDDDDDDVQRQGGAALTQQQQHQGGTTPKRRATLERADTPVMSNARRVRRPNNNTGNDDTPMVPPPVQSPPYVDNMYNDDDDYVDPAARADTTTATSSMPEYEAPLSRIYIQQCTSYHDALVVYVKSKRRLVERMELLRREKELISQSSSQVQQLHQQQQQQPAIVVDDTKLLDEEHRIETDLLRTLSSLAFDKAAILSSSSSSSSSNNTASSNMQDPGRKEGNFWLLVARLRELGMDALIWANDNADGTERRNLHALTIYKESLASRVTATPLELVQALHSNNAPLILRRRLQILSWLHDCFRRVLPAGCTRPRTTNNILSLHQQKSELLSTQGLYETDQDGEILRLCLALVLAGRLDDAKRLVRESGLAWRAALWSGDAPHGYQVVNNNNNSNQENQTAALTSQRQVTSKAGQMVAVGNTRRPLWKVMIWKQSESLAKDPKASKEEAAIASILANNLKMSLDNACLRNWEKGLYVSMRAVLGRIEDEVLHAHNNIRRRRQQQSRRPSYPGTEFESKEHDHLVATSNVAPLTEAGIIQMLASSPFEEMRNDDPLTVATAAFLVGKSAVMAFMQQSRELLDKGDESTLRFMAHLALYLDSLSACSTPLNISEISAWKNDIVLLWVDHLASREELWKLVVLYVSLLPENVIIENLPVILSNNIESQQQRSVIVAQMQEFLPNPNLDRIVLQEVVRLVLLEQDDAMISGHDEDDDDDDDDAPSYTDDRKMRAILWLCQSNAHLGDALIFSNTLLRQFLLTRYKLKSAFRFIDDIRPPQVLDLANGTVTGQDDDDVDESMEDEEQYSKQVQDARWEHLAFQFYLNAEKDVVSWREVLASSDTSVVIEDGIDVSQLNATEAAIAKSTERRKVTEIKRELSSTVISAANEALEGLTRVLQHPGGWLFIEPEDMSDDEQEQNRYEELKRLRVQLLPNVAMRYLEVCSETAAWLSASLDDGVAQLNGKPDTVLLTLDDARDGVSSSPMAPIYWTRQALQLVDDITSETMTVEKACGVCEIKEILRKIADIAVEHLMYSSDLGQSPEF